ncbi:MAG: hypothetical protein AB7F22_07295 [Reyranella sp.]|uniref:hypothetical protein n=1 Tax=Reyranella sp. TaxID=1929291 RepID=UPI003D10A81B
MTGKGDKPGSPKPRAPEADSPRSSSPVCYIDEADDTYMGFASKEEIAAFLVDLAEAERSGRPTDEMLRRMLPRIRDDHLHRELTARLKSRPDT